MKEMAQYLVLARQDDEGADEEMGTDVYHYRQVDQESITVHCTVISMQRAVSR